MRAARSAALRTSSHPEVAADAHTPVHCGRRLAPYRRAARKAMTSRTAAMPACAMTVPSAEPATPHPSP